MSIVKALIYQGIPHSYASKTRIIFGSKTADFRSERHSDCIWPKSSFQIVWHDPGGVHFSWNSLTMQYYQGKSDVSSRGWLHAWGLIWVFSPFNIKYVMMCWLYIYFPIISACSESLFYRITHAHPIYYFFNAYDIAPLELHFLRNTSHCPQTHRFSNNGLMGTVSKWKSWRIPVPGYWMICFTLRRWDV